MPLGGAGGGRFGAGWLLGDVAGRHPVGKVPGGGEPGGGEAGGGEAGGGEPGGGEPGVAVGGAAAGAEPGIVCLIPTMQPGIAVLRCREPGRVPQTRPGNRYIPIYRAPLRPFRAYVDVYGLLGAWRA